MPVTTPRTTPILRSSANLITVTRFPTRVSTSSPKGSVWISLRVMSVRMPSYRVTAFFVTKWFSCGFSFTILVV